ncbi:MULTISPECIES: hypothetical protein [Paraburkholderia]|uniref:Uncharacterized protein n=1 Tax=Paraburkholderia dioscoreae TaxID=2604047 RepID=A0A5Q4ZBJ6_9BURK|nr:MULTISPECIES: hypothetical protein [Paraburkholderia]MDR8397036.1 hypothetical protein [Paraburkholderia sp. USG1]VVD27594.1 conserved protein of unknown function [Paraburkholderia dioscoreae]
MSDTGLPSNSPARILATKHIEDKLKILQLWSCDGIPWKTDDLTGQTCLDENDEKVLDYFPTYIKAFALWDGSQNCRSVREQLGSLHRCSRTTLSQTYHSTLNDEIEQTLSKLKSNSVSQIENSNKSLTIERQSQEISRLEKLICRQECDVVELTMQRHDAVKKLRDEKDAHKRNRVQWKEEKAELEAKISELTKTLRKLTPLKSRTRK